MIKDGKGQENIAARQATRAQTVESKRNSILYIAFRDRFVSYRWIPSRTIMAANRRDFCAVGTGNMKIGVLNSKTSTITLSSHTPDMSLYPLAGSLASLLSGKS